MDLKRLRGKLVGSEEERAVSPVIGVILMVAITVILAAVIAAFVLDMGDNLGEGSVNAAVDTDVSQQDSEITFSLVESSGAESFVIRGEEGEDVYNSDSSGANENNATADGEVALYFSGTGSTFTLEEVASTKDDSDDNQVLEEEGSVNIVAIDENSESIVGDVEWDFS